MTQPYFSTAKTTTLFEYPPLIKGAAVPGVVGACRRKIEIQVVGLSPNHRLSRFATSVS